MGDHELKETVTANQAMLFYEEELAPIFCKPKLLPMKTVTMEKLEQMQREAEKFVYQQQVKPAEVQEEPAATTEDQPAGEKVTEVWSADD